MIQRDRKGIRLSIHDDRAREAAARIRAARNYAGITQQDLCERLAVSLATIKRMESGSRPISTDELMAVGEAVGVPAAFMLHGFAALVEGRPGEAAVMLADHEQRIAELETQVRRVFPR